MAQEWCVAYGVLPKKEAQRLNDIVLERKRTGKSISNSPVPEKKKKKKAKVLEDDTDPDMQASGAEAVGRMVL